MFNPDHCFAAARRQLFALALSGTALAATPFDSATVTRLENEVAVGHVENGHTHERAASVADTIKAKDYLHTQQESRAELKFPDSSIVRIGQNTVFSFDADSRTLSLQKGAILFYVKPGTGGGTIKTPSLTAAITGTVAKVSENLLAVLSGECSTKYGIVHAGEAIEYKNGEYRIYKFDPSQALTGFLMAWGGPLPEITEVDTNPLLGPADLHWLDVLEWTQVNPRLRVRPQPVVTTPTPTPTATPTPRPTRTPIDSDFQFR